MIDTMLSAGIIPDFVIRKGIQNLLKKRLEDEYESVFEQNEVKRKQLVQELMNSPIAIETDKANDQHYMVPPEFFVKCLGKRLKYSCCHWDKATDLNEAEEEMLALTVERAQIKDGDKVLELGHGWGAVTLYMARSFEIVKLLLSLTLNSKVISSWKELKSVD